MTDDAMAALSEGVENDLGSRLAQFEDGYMVNRWVAMIEVIGQDGERSLINLTTRDMRAWDTLGLLEWGKQLEQAATVNDSGEAT